MDEEQVSLPSFYLPLDADLHARSLRALRRLLGQLAGVLNFSKAPHILQLPLHAPPQIPKPTQ